MNIKKYIPKNMSKTSSILFFNKEGYPYNFQYDSVNDRWIGKLIFDENSSDTFKTIGLYIFEDVPPITISDNFDMDPNIIFNSSGITFYSNPYTGMTFNLTKIENVNSNSDFHSKWVYGENFHRIFPKGTMISLSATTGTGDYDKIYTGVTYVVSENKTNASLITTEFDNSLVYTIDGGVVVSHNAFSVPDYGGVTEEFLDSLDLFTYDSENDIYKKLTIVNSEFNDGVYDFKNSGISFSYIRDFNILGLTGSTLKLEVTLLTERPKIYTGAFNVSGLTSETAQIEFLNKMNSNIYSGVSMIFEDLNGNLIANSLIYTVREFIDRTHIGDFVISFIKNNTKRNYEPKYYLTIPGDQTNLVKIRDVITLTGDTSDTERFNINREFEIYDVFYRGFTENLTYIEVEQYVIPETGGTYSIFRKLRNSEKTKIIANTTIYSEPTGYTNGIAYLTTNVLNFTQNIILSGFTDTGSTYEEKLVNEFNSKNSRSLLNYGIITYYLNGTFVVQSIWDFPEDANYFTAKLFRDTEEISPLNSYSDSQGTCRKFQLELYQKLNKESVYLYETDKLSKPYHSDIILNLAEDSQMYGFSIIFNGNEYYIPYNSTSGDTSYQYETVTDFYRKYQDPFFKNGFQISYNAYSGYTSGITLTIDGIYPDCNVYQLEVRVNNFSTYSMTETGGRGIVIAGNEIANPDVYNFYDVYMATGMIIQVSGSSYRFNNKEYNILGVSPNKLQLSYQGPYFHENNVDLQLSTREFLRKPRGSYNKKIYYKFTWSGNDVTENIFYYDFSGDQLTRTDALAYTGPKPLLNEFSSEKVFLNKEENKFTDKVSEPKYQKTVFDEILKELEQLDSSSDYNFIPEPLQVFLGYNSDSEGVDTNIMKIEKIEYLTFSGITSNNTGQTGFDYCNFSISGDTIEYLTNDFLFDFNRLGFETNQNISLKFVDTVITGQTIFKNYRTYKIKDVNAKKLKIDITYGNLDFFYTSGSTFNFSINVEPKTVAIITVQGETEIEDERFLVNLRNLGVNIKPDDAYIFKESDVQDRGIDWMLLNRKRKEMLQVRGEIFDYIGSYKSLINAINYFGYNDLELYEYYRNIDSNSPLYTKLYKILIPDIFDNSVEGWDEMDWIRDRYNNNLYKKTNLFNLTYRVTDFWGNYLPYYSIDEVQIKLNGLVKWLRKNILPLSSNIYDITGVGSVVGTIYENYDTSNYALKFTSEQSVIAINYTMIQTLNVNNSYFITFNFYVTSGSTIPDYYSVTIKTFSLDPITNMLIPVQYFDLYQVDLTPFTFEANKDIDPYVYIETISYNDYGLGYKNNKMFKFDETTNFILINNNFNKETYKYLYTDSKYFILMDDGNFYIVD